MIKLEESSKTSRKGKKEWNKEAVDTEETMTMAIEEEEVIDPSTVVADLAATTTEEATEVETLTVEIEMEVAIKEETAKTIGEILAMATEVAIQEEIKEEDD